MTFNCPVRLALAAAGALALLGCRATDPDAPPSIAYGESPCAECGMIISDDRFSVATVVDAQRGPETLLFDDFNCQAAHERGRSDLVVVRRWARDHGTRAWLDLHAAHLVHAPSLRTPMGSHLAAFATERDARAFADARRGTIMRLDESRTALAAP